MIYFVCSVLVIIIILMAYGINNVLNKYEKLEAEFEKLQQDHVTVLERVLNAVNTMRSIDERGMFEKDDEVGQVFQQLVDISLFLAQYIEVEKE
jgi:hypothetical protein